MLAHLDPIDRTFLAQASSACRAAVSASKLPRAGTSQVGQTVWLVLHRLEEFCTSVERLAWAKAAGCLWDWQTCRAAAAGGHLDALQWARAHGRVQVDTMKPMVRALGTNTLLKR